MGTMQRVSKSMLKAKKAFANCTDPEVAPHLEFLGYGTAKIDTGRAILTMTQDLIADQQKQYGDQFGATADFNEKRKAAEKVHHRTIKLARIEFKDDSDIYNALGLAGRRKQAFDAWYKEASVFHKNLTPEIITRLSRFNLTQEEMDSEKALIEAVMAADAKQQKEAAEAQAATKKRDESIDVFNAWMSEFYKIADVALEEYPQLKEKLGLIDPS